MPFRLPYSVHGCTFVLSMEAVARMLFFIPKRPNPEDIDTEFLLVYGFNTLALSTAYKWHRLFVDGKIELCDDRRRGQPDAMISLSPSATCFGNAFDIMQEALCPLRESKRYMLAHSTRSLRSWNVQLCWVPRSLDSHQKGERATFSHGLPEVLKNGKESDFHNAVADDELWLYFEYPHKWAWVTSRDEVPGRINQIIDTWKCVFRIIWFVNGIYSLIDVPKGTIYDSLFFCDSFVFDWIVNFCAQSWRKTLNGIVVHLDNARPHKLRQSFEYLERFRAGGFPHSPHRLDVARLISSSLRI
jgi:hypothetical protein